MFTLFIGWFRWSVYFVAAYTTTWALLLVIVLPLQWQVKDSQNLSLVLTLNKRSGLLLLDTVSAGKKAGGILSIPRRLQVFLCCEYHESSWRFSYSCTTIHYAKRHSLSMEEEDCNCFCFLLWCIVSIA